MHFNQLDKARQVFSDVIIHSKYAKHIPEKERRENWEEIVTRNMEMHLAKFPKLAEEIEEAYEYVYDRKVLPSMRAMQFSGKPIEISPNRAYNCSALPMDSIEAFSELMFLLLGGSGVGISVQKHHVEKLPVLRGDIKEKDNGDKKRRYLIGDSIEGWADAIKVLIESYFLGKREIEFDYRDIRPKGAKLVTSGGKAPGPQPLKDCIHNIRKILDNALFERGKNTHLTPIEIFDISCYIADAVLAGGIRRAAIITFFSFDDEEMLISKSGNWWETNPQRGRSNNSVVLIRHKMTKEDFSRIFEMTKASKAGEPGFFLSNDKEFMMNPCGEASLKPNTFCNLTTINASLIENQEDFEKACAAAALIGTLQATYTEFHYLRDIWREATEKDALLGVSITGIANKHFLENINLTAGAEAVMKENERVAKLVGIKKAARTTLVKPEGTTSSMLGTSSGIHAWHSEYYIRRMRVAKNEAIYVYFKINNPDLIEDDLMNPNQAILKFPIAVPEGAITREESAISLLERMKKVQKEWIEPGHRKGSNKHNVSITVNVRDNEWDEVKEWMWENKEYYSGISLLPFDGGSYVQAPFEECTKEEYEQLLEKVHSIDVNNIIEIEDKVHFAAEAACGGGGCEFK